MNICVDVGNTMVKIGFFLEDELVHSLSFITDEKKTDNEFFAILKSQIDTYDITFNTDDLKIIYSSVVPSINHELLEALKKLFKVDILILGNGVKTGLPLKVDNPQEVGSDLIADVVGAKEKFSYPTIICNLGTATKILLLDKDGYFSSAILTPGISISKEILVSKGEMLPNVTLNVPKRIVARNTIDAMNVGIVYGHTDMILGLVKRLENELGYTCKKILTGGGSIHIKDIIGEDFIYDKNLCLEGLNIILKKNIKG